MIIVIHPGSFNLRIGRASDLNPHRMLHAVARLRKPGGLVYADQFLPPAVPMVSSPSLRFCQYIFIALILCIAVK